MGIQDLFENISNTVTELTSVGEVLMPINKAWEEANWMEMATFGFQNFEGVKDAFSTLLASLGSQRSCLRAGARHGRERQQPGANSMAEVPSHVQEDLRYLWRGGA